MSIENLGAGYNRLIKGNERLEVLRQLINSGDATEDEKKEWELTLNLYDRESQSEKTWREHPDWYREVEELKNKNEEARNTEK